jgi:multicomponent Na+:H+ antiporter subunit E
MSLGTNLLLALLWAALIGPFTPTNLLVGYLVGYVILRISVGRAGRSSYARRLRGAVNLAGFTVLELIKANLRVAWYTVSRLRDLRPAVLEVPLDPTITDAEITLLGALITLTPGTLTVDVADDADFMYIHYMHVEDVDEAVKDIKQGFERRILEATR